MIQLVHSEGDQPWDFFGRNAVCPSTSPTLWSESSNIILLSTKELPRVGAQRVSGNAAKPV